LTFLKIFSFAPFAQNALKAYKVDKKWIAKFG
jgi:hypothetical protein